MNIARNARLLGYRAGVNEEAVKSVSRHFQTVARREGFPVGAPLEYDYGQYLHQVPGGVIANLVRQLGEMKAPHLLSAVQEEAMQVRKDLGYPIMITPFSQHVATQATINVILGGRYREVTDELIQYCLGNWGEAASSGVEANVKQKILDRPRAREIAGMEHYEPSLDEFRRKLGGPRVSDDELVLRFMLDGEEQLNAARPALPIGDYPTESHVVALVTRMMTQRELQRIHFEQGSLLLDLRKGGKTRHDHC